MIEARRLSCGYGRVAAVHDVDITVERGEVVALLGPNGAGKSTLLRTIAGVLPPLSGAVVLDGRPAAAALHRRARHGLAYVPEERSVIMGLTAAENLRLGRGAPARALELFPELEAHLGRRAGLLSGGQQQILALARALASDPKMLVADELSLGLAPQVVERLLGAVRAAAARGVAVLLVEQHVDQVCAVADRVCIVRQGRIVLSGTPADIVGRMDVVGEAYLGRSRQAASGDGRAEAVSSSEPDRLVGRQEQGRIDDMTIPTSASDVER